MEAVVKLLAGLVMLAVSLSYLYRPSYILKVNELARGVLFNDAYVLHYRRRWGMPLFVASIVFLYSGMANLKVQPTGPEAASYGEMDEAYRAFYTRRYADAERLCRGILQLHPRDPHAGFLLRQTLKANEEGDPKDLLDPSKGNPHRP